MKPISLEVVFKFLTTYGHCVRCEPIFNEAGLSKKSRENDIDEYPAELKEESENLSKLICELHQLYMHRIHIQLIDAQSPLGIYKAIVHRFRKYPTFVVEKKDSYSGWDRRKIEALIDKYIKADKP
jgi:hypothetical protein